ncbi:MAG: hypothetical protein Q7U12_09035, partial [Undibacterium sp.]|nr:hypothetical protein [Undibacterium sp.]
MQMFKKLAVAVAIAVAFPVTAMAQSTKELKAELDALKAHVKQLEALIVKVSAQADKANVAAG